MSLSTQNILTPWEVNGAVDYEKIIADFGAENIHEQLIYQVEKNTGQRAHRFLRRGIFFAHRDFDKLLAEASDNFYLYTGRGPSSDALHFGHLVPLLFTQYLQQAFRVPLVFQMTDDEKYIFKNLTFEQADFYTRENARDILALDFDLDRTFLFQNTKYVQELYPNVLAIQRQVNANTISKIFGFSTQESIGKWAFPPMQIAPCFPTSFRGILRNDMKCLVPCAIDQEPYFRLARTVAPQLKYDKPAIIASKFFPALQGVDSKMSSTSQSLGPAEKVSTIFLNDSAKQIDKAIKSAFSGGRDTKEEHIKMGANLEIDVAYQWLRFFMEDDDRLHQIGQDYQQGKLFTSDVKKILCQVLTDFADQHAKKRAKVTDEQLELVMSRRSLL